MGVPTWTWSTLRLRINSMSSTPAIRLGLGKHALVEKPMTLIFYDADVMIQAAKRDSADPMVNVKHSFHLPI